MVSVPPFDPDGAVISCKTTSSTSRRSSAQEKLQFLARGHAIPASSFDYRATLPGRRAAVPVLADICVVDLVDERGDVSRLEIAFANSANVVQLAPFRSKSPRADGTALGRAIRMRQPLLFPDCSPAALASTGEEFEHEVLLRLSGAQSMMVVPLVARDRVLGVLTLIAAESGRRYSGSALSTASDLATHAALAIDNALLYERAQQAIRAREDVLSFVSHDLRNPLMGILLTTDTLLDDAARNVAGWKQLNASAAACSRCGT
jgi:GAF domain-containing protein